MGLFCGKKCKCKNRCEADLRSMGKDVLKGCYSACKTSNPPADGLAYLESLPSQARILAEQESYLQEQFQDEFATGPEGINPILIVAVVIAVALIIIYVKRK